MTVTEHAAPNPSEQTVWRGGPSQLSSLGLYILCILFCWLIVPAIIALVRFLKTRYTRYELTTERLRITTGVLSRHVEEVELYRVKDTTLSQSFLNRLLGMSDITLMTSDKTTPVVVLRSLSDGQAVREQIRRETEKMRLRKGVREID